MKFYHLVIYLFVLSSVLYSCDGSTDLIDSGSRNKEQKTALKNHSYSNCKDIKTKHLHLELDVNFENKTIYGIARHEMINSGVDTAIFDIKSLEIQKITLGKKGEEVETDFIIGENDELIGQPLLVKIDKSTRFVNIYYKTTDHSEAIDWLPSKLTQGKKFPFMYTQGQAILTRTWIPIQDVPSNRITYSADVKVPSDLRAIMSASNPKMNSNDGTYHFEMKQPISSYLIAIAVGNLQYRKLGKNCGVYSEPELLGKCAYEFVDLPKMMSAAEDIYGKYQWEQYDIVVLPYSFPFGGMENPRLTFANPTLITGDRSLVSVIAHELAHSWSGNLVTNSSWDDLWLNEGFTVYFENRIMEQIYGKETADMLALIGFKELKDEVKIINAGDHPEDTKLKLELAHRNPDEGMTSIAYEKGAFFLKTLEAKVGRKLFDNFLKNYFKKFAFNTISTEKFESYLTKKLLLPNKINFNTKEWLYEKGVPQNCINIESKRFNDIQKMAAKFVAGDNIFKVKRKKYKITRDKYNTQEWLQFIRCLPVTMRPEQLALVDKHLNFKACGNSEIMTEWYILCLKNKYKAIRPEMKVFLTTVGRRKYLEPIYSTLSNNSDDLKWAKKVFSEAKENYHYLSYSSIEQILYPSESHANNL